MKKNPVFEVAAKDLAKKSKLYRAISLKQLVAFYSIKDLTRVKLREDLMESDDKKIYDISESFSAL